MILKPTRFLPFVIVIILFVAGYKARKNIGLRILPTSDIPVDFAFTDETEKLGIHFRHEDPLLDLNGNTRLLFYGAGAAAADFDGDGWMDLLLPTSKPGAKSHLYLNDHGQRFIEASEKWGLADLSEKGAPTTPVVFDYDNDGRPDLFMARVGCSLLFHNTGKKFEKMPFNDCSNSSSGVPIDTDNDGLLDLYVVRYWPAFDYFKLSGIYPYPNTIDDSINGGVNQLYRNSGRSFEPSPLEKSGADPHWSIDAAAGRISPLDKRLRIYTANDWGRDSIQVTSEGGLVADKVAGPPFERRSSMSVSFGDLDSSGYPFIYVSNIYIPEYMMQENFLWKLENRKATDRAHTYGVHACGWAWGSVFADFNLDGLQDLYVTNGMITGSSSQEYNYLAATNMALPDALRNTAAGWPPIRNRSLAGRQIDCVFLNTAKGFVNVARQVGVRDHWDGRAVALVDFDNNGAPDLLVSAQDGSPHFLRNTTNPGKHWVGFKLVGKKSNRDGVGARLEVIQEKRSFFRWATGGRTGAMATSEPRLHFGLPSTAQFSVEIQWPSGITQRFSGVEPGRYYTVDETATSLN